MRTSFTLLAAALLAASVAANEIQPEARATPAPLNRAVRRADVIISGGSISCPGKCADGSMPDERCNCGIASNGNSFGTTVLGPDASSADSGSASSESGESSSTDIFGPGGIFGTSSTTSGSSSSTASSSSSSASSTMSRSTAAIATPTRDPNAASVVGAPGLKAAAAGLALGVAAFVL